MWRCVINSRTFRIFLQFNKNPSPSRHSLNRLKHEFFRLPFHIFFVSGIFFHVTRAPRPISALSRFPKRRNQHHQMEMKQKNGKNASLTSLDDDGEDREKNSDNAAEMEQNNTLMNTRANNKFLATYNDKNEIPRNKKNPLRRCLSAASSLHSVNNNLPQKIPLSRRHVV